MKDIIYETVLNNNLIAEIVCLFIAIMFLGFMLQTKPKPSRMFMTNLWGVIFAITTIVLQLLTAGLCTFLKVQYMWLLRVMFVLYYFSYLSVLALVYSYIEAFSRRFNNENKRNKRITLSTFNTSYVLCTFYTVFGGNTYSVHQGIIKVASIGRFHLWFGITMAALSMLTTILVREKIPKMINNYVIFFCTLDIILLLAQFIFPDIIFLSVTYVFAFVIFYVLFHSNPMDENNGCRNEYAFTNAYGRALKSKKNCAVINIYLPRNKNVETNDRDIFIYMLSEMCRRIERVDKTITIYSKNAYTYNVILAYKTEAELDLISREITNILTEPILFNNIRLTVTSKVLVIKIRDILDSSDTYNTFVKILDRKYFTQSVESELYKATDEDYVHFEEYSVIYNALYDIRNQMNFNDDRVVCLAQPIYEIATGKFKTAEALMRLNINGKTYYPDTFIPIAEDNNFIHILTCTMINKVCKAILALQQQYEIDAITVNSSTLEFDDSRFSEDVFGIIQANQLDPSKIRIEITESEMVDGYKNIVSNMKSLREEKIYCYLDDFGTGYSNIERIMGCPFHTVKFDKSIFKMALEDGIAYDVMTSMIEAFKRKGFRVLVEGIEDEVMKDKAVESGFEYIQGYYYSRPVPIMDLKDFLTSK